MPSQWLVPVAVRTAPHQGTSPTCSGPSLCTWHTTSSGICTWPISTWHDGLTTSVRVYLHVDDADALHAQWAVADLGGQLHPLSATDYGLREAAYADPDGNLLRFGSPLVPT